MNKKPLIKLISYLLIGIALLALLLTVPLTLIGKNRFRSSLENAFREELGYELTIAGDLSLSLFPRLEFSLDDIRLANPAHSQELASARHAVLVVDLGELSNNRLRIDELGVRGLHINHRVGTDGVSTWNTPALSESVSVDHDSEDGADSAGLSIGRITIEDSSVDFQDLHQGRNYSLRELNMETLEANDFGEEFHLNGRATLASFSPLHGDNLLLPLTLGADINFDSEAKEIEISELQLGLSPMLALLSGKLNWDSGELVASGSITADTFDLNDLLRSLEPESLGQFETLPLIGVPVVEYPTAFEFDFTSDRTGFRIQDFDATVNSAVVDADFVFTTQQNSLPANLNYSLRASDLDFSFLTLARANFWQGFPLQLLSNAGLNTTAAIDVDSIKWGQRNLNRLKLFISEERGVRNIELQRLGIDTGSIEGSLRINAQNAQANSYVIDAALRRVDVAMLQKFAPWAKSLSGQISADLVLTASGNTWPAVANSLNGDVTFDVQNNLADISLIKQVFSSISALSPVGGSTESWPNQMHFAQLGGFFTLTDGLGSPHTINIILDNLELDGQGQVDIMTGDFDYDLTFTLLPDARTQSLQINKTHVGKPWPVKCAANINSSTSQFCSPVFAAVRELFAQTIEPLANPTTLSPDASN